MKKNYKLLLKFLQKPTNQGITLTELLVALVISGIILAFTASGFINVLRANRDVESKSTQLSNLTRALTFIQEDIKQGVSVESIPATSGGECDSAEISSGSCLIIRFAGANNNIFDFNNNQTDDCTADDRRVVYGFQDISDPSSNSAFLKPGVLKRDVFCTTSVSLSRWEEVADGLISVKEDPQTLVCNFGTGTASGPHGQISGGANDGKGGFQFCVETENNRLVRVGLYGHIISSDSDTPPMNVDVVTFARGSQPN
ncbi:hypothetical protein Cyast_2833 [Cyanobacterium stanieri PCC 7202]|uniref:Prepilin-type N-terminal cleavage/methylation domain-containing protein n=1 Tax=Cyanobacterium stanieri (strain ATCC 29140 / PCC 7202) TaxID=292563 RepID=K9YRP9_CYASC|nr:hypothetical protein Cyast_2833 [Cyanobacterium stanieri PCC 7202]